MLRATSSVTDHGDHNRSLASADVALYMEDLLPGTKYELSLRDGHGQRWPEQRALQMRVAVAIMPGLLVAVRATGWDQLIQDGGQIMLQSRLELNRPHRSCAADVENVDRASLDTRRGHDRRD